MTLGEWLIERLDRAAEDGIHRPSTNREQRRLAQMIVGCDGQKAPGKRGPAPAKRKRHPIADIPLNALTEDHIDRWRREAARSDTVTADQVPKLWRLMMATLNDRISAQHMPE